MDCDGYAYIGGPVVGALTGAVVELVLYAIGINV